MSKLSHFKAVTKISNESITKKKAMVFRQTLFAPMGILIHTFYFRQQPPPKKYTDTGLSPLHSRCLAMINQLPSKHYTLGMDNLYTSVRFARAAYLTDQKVMIHGVIRPVKRGVPEIVRQVDMSTKEDKAEARNNLKVSKLVGTEPGVNIVIASIYDSKPVYILSNCCEEVKWIVKQKKCFQQLYNRLCKFRSSD